MNRTSLLSGMPFSFNLNNYASFSSKYSDTQQKKQTQLRIILKETSMHQDLIKNG